MIRAIKFRGSGSIECPDSRLFLLGHRRSIGSLVTKCGLELIGTISHHSKVVNMESRLGVWTVLTVAMIVEGKPELS
jgi:hypothetical protein